MAVNKGQWIYIAGTEVRLLLPNDLPDGTTLTVTVTDEELLAKAENLSQIGDVLDFSFTFPSGFEDYQGSYQLIMGYDNNTTGEVNIYYFNEVTGTWENQKGTVDSEAQEVSLVVSHFSNYGVFAHAETPIPEDPEDPKPSDGSGDPKDNKTSNGTDDKQKEETPGPKESGNDDDNDNETAAGDNNQRDTTDKQDEKYFGLLPQTATDQYNLLLAGVLLIGAAVMMWYMQRRGRAVE
ncbi:LPXTG-motif cell wall-anchored protein [Gracilibacillus alcaliphilus]|nr:LPXTG-motif cell wall-anchored protein [Gracilibacillus alcaliphilus]